MHIKYLKIAFLSCGLNMHGTTERRQQVEDNELQSTVVHV